jgi:hypothetical protein
MEKKELLKINCKLIDRYGEVKEKLEFEDHNFKINSDGWKKITVNEKRYLVNSKKDIWEFLDDKAKGEQLFTWDSAMRETKKAGKHMPTNDEFDELLNTKEDMPNILYVGYQEYFFDNINSGYSAGFWTSSLFSSSEAWLRSLYLSHSKVYVNMSSKARGFSVRCLRVKN